MFQHTRSLEQSFWRYMTEDLNQRLKERLRSVCASFFFFFFLSCHIKLFLLSYMHILICLKTLSRFPRGKTSP